MADLIDRQALIERHCEGCNADVREVCKNDPICASLMWVVEEPSVDAVEVIRCKDCKHRGDYGCPMYYEEYSEWVDDGYHEREIVEHDCTRDDGFCDLGERREDDG